MNNAEREMVLIIFDADDEAEIERVIVFKDRETALNTYEQFILRSVLTMAEINREVTPPDVSIKQTILPGLDDE